MSQNGSPPTGQKPETIRADDRLDSWKAISSYLNRDLSTLRRWEEKEGLPVHRQQNRSRVSIFAFKSELDAWKGMRLGTIDGEDRLPETAIAPEPMPAARPPIAVMEPPAAPPRVARAAPPPRHTRHSGGRLRWIALPIALVFVVSVALAVSLTLSRTAANPASRIRSIAVLPIKDLSPTSDEAFADGLTEALTNDLAQISALRVISRDSMMPYKTMPEPLRRIARNLRVEGVIRASVVRAAGRVRVMAELIEAKTGTNLWAATYERELGGVLTLQAEIAHDIAEQIGVGMTAQQELRLSAAPRPATLDAQQAYFDGLNNWSKLSCEGFQGALENFQQVAASVPNYAPVHVRLANTYFKLAEFRCQPQRAMILKARASAARALTLDPELAEAHALLGVLSFLYDWDWSTAASELKKATELNPNYAMAHSWYAAFLFSTGKRSDAVSELQKAMDVDPASGTTALVYGFMLYNSRRYNEAIEQFQKVIEKHPDSSLAYFGTAVAYERKRMFRKALKNYLKAKELSGASPEQIAELRASFARAGLRGYWQRELAVAASQPLPDTCWSTVSAAHIADTAQTLGFLERAYQSRCSALTSLKIDPLYDRLRSEPRFKNIMQRMALPNTGSKTRVRN